MEEFLKIDWNPPDNNETKFISSEYLKTNSCLFRILYDRNFKVFSSDSSDSEDCGKKKLKGNKEDGSYHLQDDDDGGDMEIEANPNEHNQSTSAVISEAKKVKAVPVAVTKKKNQPGRPVRQNYVPGGMQRLNFPQKSSLNTFQHADYLRFMLMWKHNTMVPKFPTPAEQKDLFTYRMLKDIVMKEQASFLSYVKNEWANVTKRHKIMKHGVKRYVEEAWQHRLGRVNEYPRFYSQFLKPIPLVYPTDRPEVQMDLLQDLLDMGEIPRFLLPTLNTLTRVCTDYSKMSIKHPPRGVVQDHTNLYKLPVSKDKNAEYFAQMHKADVVISSSGLQHIINNSLPFDKSWEIPFVVKQMKFEENGVEKMKIVVFVDKALPPKTMTVHERKLWYYKLAAKSLVCHPNFKGNKKYSTDSEDEVPLAHLAAAKHEVTPQVSGTSEDCNKNISQTIEKPIAGESSDSESSHLVIDYSSGEECGNKSPVCVAETNSSSKQKQSASVEQKVENEQSSFSKKASNGSGKFTYDSKNERKASTSENKIYVKAADEDLLLEMEMSGVFKHVPPPPKSNVTYRLWSLYPLRRSKEDLNETFLKGVGSFREVRLIVRCKMDACEKVEEFKPVCVFPKVEHQFEFGAEVMTLSEITRQWTALQFRPRATLARIHVHANSAEVLMAEMTNLQSVLQEGLALNKRVRSSSLGTLYSVLSQLVDLKPGYYLLTHSARNSGFANLLQHQKDGDYDLHRTYAGVNTKQIVDDGIPPWIPIDPNIVTPRYKLLNQIPATFPPLKAKANKLPPGRKLKKKGKKK